MVNLLKRRPTPFDPGLVLYTLVVPLCAEMCQTVSEVSALSLERHSLSRFFFHYFFCHSSALVSTDLAGADDAFVLRLNQEQPWSSCNPRIPFGKDRNVGGG